MVLEPSYSPLVGIVIDIADIAQSTVQCGSGLLMVHEKLTS